MLIALLLLLQNLEKALHDFSLLYKKTLQACEQLVSKTFLVDKRMERAFMLHYMHK